MTSELRFPVCKLCGSRIDFDTGGCSYGCDMDDTRTPERPAGKVEFHVYRLDRIEGAARGVRLPPQEGQHEQAQTVQGEAASAGTAMDRTGQPDPVADVQNQASPLEVAPARLARLLAAIEWALGVGEDFPARGDGQGPYWWRQELAQRAGLRWNGERYVEVAAGSPASQDSIVASGRPSGDPQ